MRKFTKAEIERIARSVTDWHASKREIVHLVLREAARIEREKVRFVAFIEASKRKVKRK
jgi:hypothetical protein